MVFDYDKIKIDVANPDSFCICCGLPNQVVNLINVSLNFFRLDADIRSAQIIRNLRDLGQVIPCILSLRRR
jgi:hypothetical protein